MEHQPTREKLYSTSKGYGFSPALQRTRKPFVVRNLLTLAGLVTFTGSVYAYSLLAVKQDDFSDVPMPSPEATAAALAAEKDK
ncbi:hypothetical protein V8B55DRAFT_1535320 [Mucor lusitanicus]|uniref:Cytochrome c oxidase assembly factor 3 n=2 Tax=Mucor circinelloides f. lusitanicus TaxID=29924 RepID=A0A168IAY8_MUCCL|nr:hypothetical protein FB192DRAFT_1381142 [Mucor lusitanicus]OAC99761.1 hypothetical protein MUCCIDRAFT_113203 [Mucor lusitanicus CBS 277.49]